LFERRVRVAGASTSLANEVVRVGRTNLTDTNSPCHEVLVAGEGLHVGLATGWARLRVREVQREVPADDRELAHGNSINHQN
jgi:hypothetical protein